MISTNLLLLVLLVLLVLFSCAVNSLIIPNIPSLPHSPPRRSFMNSVASNALLLPAALFVPGAAHAAVPEPRQQQDLQDYSDFTKTKEGWSFKDATPGKGGTAAVKGDRVVFDWSGYTIGYFGRPFQAKGGPQGGAFDKDLDYERTVLGSGSQIRVSWVIAVVISCRRYKLFCCWIRRGSLAHRGIY